MSENIAQTVQKVGQDIVAPDVRELKTLVVGLQKQIDQRFDAQDKKIDARFKALNQKQMPSSTSLWQLSGSSRLRMNSPIFGRVAS